MTDTQRAAFEAWCRNEGIDTDRCIRADVYSYPSARVAWRAWQAAQAADAGREAALTRDAIDRIVGGSVETSKYHYIMHQIDAALSRAKEKKS